MRKRKCGDGAKGEPMSPLYILMRRYRHSSVVVLEFPELKLEGRRTGRDSVMVL